MRLVVVTGVSGAGKSTALRALEDLGFYAVDNLPLPLVPQLIELLASAPRRRPRGAGRRRAQRQLPGRGRAGVRRRCARAGHTVEVLFLDASDEILIRRFSETRRRHPLSDTDIRAGVAAERRTLAGLRQEASAVVDTGALNVHVLRGLIQERYGRGEGELAVTLLSFGFKHGIPAEADIVLDVRFLPNPFFVPQLSALSGEDEAVVRFVMEDPETAGFLRGRRALCCAVPCTGSGARASRTRPSPSAARAGVTDLSRSPRSSAAGWATNSRFPSATATSSDVGLVAARGSTRIRLAVGGKIRGSMATAQRRSGWPGHRDARWLRRMPARRRRGHRRAGRRLDRGLASCRRESFDDIVRRVGRACDEVDSGVGILILADVHGSSPFRACLAMVDGTRPVEIVVRREPADADQAGDLRSPRACGRPRWRSWSRRWASGRSGWARS